MPTPAWMDVDVTADVGDRGLTLNGTKMSARSGLICIGWILAGVLILPWDLQLSAWFINDGLPGDIRAWFHRLETFGHAYGLICIAITILVLDPKRRNQIPGLVVVFAAAGLLADAIKLTVWRTRPRPYFESGADGSTFVGTIWTQFDQAWETMTNHAYHSFPSAHTACAVALAYQLSRIYPSGRTWFFTLAAMCAMNRIDGGAHFASDVCWGVAVGYATACALARVPWRIPSILASPGKAMG